MEYVFGIDIGGTSIKCGLFTTLGELKEKWEIPTRTQEQGKFILGDIAKDLLEKCSLWSLERENIAGVGLGVPGPVTADGIVQQCVNLGWKKLHIEKQMQDLTGFSVKAANDANVAALGELWMGGGKGYQSIVLVTLGTGVGSGVILDGKVIHGSCGAAGEIGHLVMNPAETRQCACGGFGHLEQYASATGLVNLAKFALEEKQEPSCLREEKELTAKAIFDAAKKGDSLAETLVNTMCSYLGRALANVAMTLDPEVFVLGGGVSKAGDMIAERVNYYYNSNILEPLKQKEIRMAQLGNDAGIYGSAKLVL